MGKAATKLRQTFGFGGKNANDFNGDIEPAEPKPPQWDTTIDELFEDSPSNENGISPAPVLDAPMRPRKRRRPPPVPPSIFNRGGAAAAGRRRVSPAARRKRPRGNVHAMQTPIVPDLPKRVATGGVHAVNAPFGINRRPMVLPAPVMERDVPGRVVLRSSFKRRPSRRRSRPSSQRTQRLQELLQCPVCLAPYIEPRLLPCGHTYCDQCLNRLIQDDNDIVTCPECRKQHLVPADGVFPSNFVVRNLLEEQGLTPNSRLLTTGNLSLNVTTTAKCTTCKTFAPLRLCRHCNFMVCDRCLHSHRLGTNDQDSLSKRSKILNGKVIEFYIAVRKITRSHSQVKRLTIDMPIGNYIRDSIETLIQRIIDREQLELTSNQLLLEFGDKRLSHQRTLASYGIQNGDLLFLFNPEQRLHFLAYNDDEDNSLLSNQNNSSRLRLNSSTSSVSDIRTATTTNTNDIIYNRSNPPLSTISDHDDDYYTSSYSSEN